MGICRAVLSCFGRSDDGTSLALALWHSLWIAIPSAQGRVSPVFDTASRLLVVCRQRRREVERKEYVLGALTEAMRQELEKIPGLVHIFEQPIANTMAEMLTGTEGQIAVKLFGPDLEVLNAKVHEMHQVLSQIPGIADLQIEQAAGIPEILMLIVGLAVLVVLFASLGSLRQSLLLLLNVSMPVAGGIVVFFLTGQTLNFSSLTRADHA